MAIYINGKKVAGVGMPGKDGKSAYQLAVEGGYQGTEEEFSQILANGGLPSGGTPGQMLYQGESGAEWGDKPVMYVNVTQDSSSTGLSADKTSEEIYQAFQNGYAVFAVLPEDRNIVVPLQSAIEIEQGSYGLIFMSFTESRELIIQIINHSDNGDVVTASFTKLGANDIAFTPGTTGLTATNVQDAIEEVNGKIQNIKVIRTVGELPEAFTYSSLQTIGAYGSDKFVFLTIDSGPFYSTDGLSWNSTDSNGPTGNSGGVANGITYGNGKFVAVPARESSIYCSDDGITWTKYSIEPYDWALDCNLGFGNGRFVLLTEENWAMYSEDGVSWTRVEIPESIVIGRYDSNLVYGNGIFAIAVAVGRYGTSGNKILYSVDNGVNWMLTESAILTESSFTGMAFGNGKFVCTSGKEISLYSSDAITWTQSSLPFVATSIAYGNGIFVVAAISNGQLSTAYSDDGIVWNENPVFNLDGTAYCSLVFGNDRFVIVTNAGKSAISFDGVTWESELSFVEENGEDITEDLKYALDVPSLPNFRSITLSASGWSSNTQAVTVSGVLADETAQLIQPMPAVASQNAYITAGVICSGQAANQLTFKCSTVPTDDISLYVVITEVSA